MAESTFDFRRDYLGKEKFDVVMKRWVAQAAVQLRDDMRVQRIYPEGEVHQGGTYQATTGRGKSKQSLTVRRKRSWFEENEYRRTHNASGKQWFATGLADDVTSVRIINATMQNGLIDFQTTAGMLYAELGVGLAGAYHARGKTNKPGKRRGPDGKMVAIKRKRIRVDRHAIAKGHGRDKFVDHWKPLAGHTHRPSVRRQRGLLIRRLKWAAWKVHDQKLLYWLVDTCSGVFNAPHGQIVQGTYSSEAKTGYKVVGQFSKKQMAERNKFLNY